MGGLSTHDYEEIELYFSQKLAGSIGVKDLIYIDTLIAQNERIRRHWLEFCEEFNKEDVRTHFSRLDMQEKWKPLSATELGLEARAVPLLGKVVRKKYMSLYAAAMVAGIIICIGMASLFIPKKVQPSIKTLLQREEFVLKLANGQVIDLSKLNDGGQQGIHYNQNENLVSFDATFSGSGLGILKVPAGKSLSVLLSDGSKMMINSSTEVRFPVVFDAHEREVAVKGEAYFSVAKDPARPFTVHTTSGEVQVLGTEFNLNSYYASKMEVTLVQGSVKVVTKQSQVTIKPGTTAIAGDQEMIRVEQSKDDHVLSWRTGIYYFENSDVQEIKEILERWYNLNISLDRAEILNQRFTGAIDRSRDVSIFLENLTAVTTIKYTIDSAHNVHLH